MNTRLILVTGDKGGVGKTTTARVIADYMEQGNSNLAFFDTDKTNATFRRFIGEKCKLLDPDKQGSLDELIDEVVDLPKGTQVLIDCAARSLDSILDWMDQIEFETVLTDSKLDLAIIFVLGSDKDSLQILSDLHDDMDSFEINPQYFIVKNYGRSGDYSQYETSKIREKLKAKKALEICIPSLLERTTLAMDKNNLRFNELDSASTEKLSITDKQRAKSFIRKSFESIKETEL